MMKISISRNDLRIGMVLKNKNPYPGEGERIVAEMGVSGFKAIVSCCEKFPELNGTVEIMGYSSLPHYEEVG